MSQFIGLRVPVLTYRWSKDSRQSILLTQELKEEFVGVIKRAAFGWQLSRPVITCSYRGVSFSFAHYPYDLERNGNLTSHEKQNDR